LLLSVITWEPSLRFAHRSHGL